MHAPCRWPTGPLAALQACWHIPLPHPHLAARDAYQACRRLPPAGGALLLCLLRRGPLLQVQCVQPASHALRLGRCGGLGGCCRRSRRRGVGGRPSADAGAGIAALLQIKWQHSVGRGANRSWLRWRCRAACCRRAAAAGHQDWRPAGGCRGSVGLALLGQHVAKGLLVLALVIDAHAQCVHADGRGYAGRAAVAVCHARRRASRGAAAAHALPHGR